MASTRIRDDPDRIQEQLLHSTFSCNYNMNAPGNGGVTPDYMEDPHIRAQKWGANLMTNAVDLESNLFGIRKLGRDCLGKDEYNKSPVDSKPMQYPNNSKLYVEQPRAIAPAWELKGAPNTREKPYVFFDPLHEPKISFQQDVQTRILEKDYFNPKSLPLTTLGTESLLPRMNNR